MLLRILCVHMWFWKNKTHNSNVMATFVAHVGAFEFVHQAMSVCDSEFMYSKKAVSRKIQMIKVIDFVIKKIVYNYCFLPRPHL